MNQHRITLANVQEAHHALLSFAQEFVMLYCQHLATRIHFVRPCIHSLVHLPCEVIRIGPPICSSQWTLERTIGNLGEEIKQHSNPFANLSQHGIQRTRVNALKAMIPDLDINGTTKESSPLGCKDVGQGYVYSVQEKKKHALCETVRGRHYATSWVLSLVQIRFACTDGQSSAYLLDRIATVHGRSSRCPLKGVKWLITSRYLRHHIFLYYAA